MAINIREAGIKDVPLILEFIRSLAEYEHLLDQVSATEEKLRRSLFEEKNAAVSIAEYDGSEAGFALYFNNYSTFLAQKGIYLEDLFVKPEYRGKGIGKALLAHVAAIAIKQNCGRLEWACLDWNKPSIAFYKSQGACPMDQWTVYRVTGKALEQLSKE